MVHTVHPRKVFQICNGMLVWPHWHRTMPILVLRVTNHGMCANPVSNHWAVLRYLSTTSGQETQTMVPGKIWHGGVVPLILMTHAVRPIDGERTRLWIGNTIRT